MSPTAPKPPDLTRFHVVPKDRTMTMRLPSAMVEALKLVAEREKMPYQALIRQYLADALIQEAAKIRASKRRPQA